MRRGNLRRHRLIPAIFFRNKNGRDSPSAITHPEFFYGFVEIALVFQFVFLAVARDSLKYRALMPITVPEKLSFAIPPAILYFQNRLASLLFAAGLIDLILGAFFVAAFLKTEPPLEK